ncbi:MAG TPA: tryptophan synthase subunit alpha [Rectinemataceae bacterium]|nr:tryptophan synthase subunit alpha [Rectinemataceae bacterium]
MSGCGRIEATFASLGGIGLMTHAVCGYPDMEASARILLAASRSGADFLEAQLPFSEPSADGPLIVGANHEALRRGAGTAAALGMLAALRRTCDTPILVMSYLNPLIARGIDRILGEIGAAGLDGLIVPDYPDDELEYAIAEKCAALGLAFVPLIAPTTSLERAASLAAASNSPFVYSVLRLGVTGRRTELDATALAGLDALKERTGRRVAAGFGIAERAQVEALSGHADCAVVGSALLSRLMAAIGAGEDPAEAAAGFVASLARSPSGS